MKLLVNLILILMIINGINGTNPPPCRPGMLSKCNNTKLCRPGMLTKDCFHGPLGQLTQ